MEKPFDFILPYVAKFIENEFGEDIEIEARLGQIVLSLTDDRITFKTPHPVVFTNLSKFMKFKNGVGESDYKQLLRTVSDGAELKESHSTVFVAKGERKIVEETENGLVETYQIKNKRKCLDVYLPMFKYDLRLQISKEKKIEKSQTNFESAFSRKRVRKVVDAETVSFDFTTILDAEGKSFEAEIEMKKNINAKEFLTKIFKLLY